MLPKITTQFESLKPSFRKIDRMEDLLSRINADFDILERQMDEAEGTVEEGKLKNVLKMPLNLIQKQLSVSDQSSSIIASTFSSPGTFVPHNIFKTEEYFDEK